MFSAVILTRVGLLVLSLIALTIAWWQQRTGARRIDVDRAFLVLGLFGVLSFGSFGAFHGPGFGLIHTGEMFTYYMGAKYAPELGYDGLYVATLQADAESPAPRLSDAKVGRDLRNGEVVPIEQLREDRRVRERFSDERWAAFRADLGWFLGTGTAAHWKLVVRDHGYNAPPSRTVLVAAVAAVVGPATDLSIHAIAFLDVLLLVALVACVYATVGARAAALACVLLGANSLSAFEWVGGSFLRQDWLAASVLGVCALRSGRSATAGVLLGVATMLRVFPGLFAAALLLGAGVRLYRERALSPEVPRFVAGLVIAALAIGVPSLLYSGIAGWQEFLVKITQHVAMESKNDMGLPALLTGQPALLRLLQAGSVIACGLAAGRVHAAGAAILGIVLVYTLGVLSCYYYSLLLLVLLWQRLDVLTPAAIARVAAAFTVPIVAGLFEAFSTEAMPTFDWRIFTSSSVMLLATVATLLVAAFRGESAELAATR